MIINSTKLVEIFCQADDFCKEFDKQLLKSQEVKIGKKGPAPMMSVSEMITIEITYHLSGWKCFKFFYKQVVLKALKSYFPQSLSYERFVYLKPTMMLHLFGFILACRLGMETGYYYVDSAKLAVCHNRRIYNHKVFKNIAQRGKTSVGWFYGLKIHLLINHLGELMAFRLTPGNVADKNRTLMNRLAKGLKGVLFGDKGYISKKVFEDLFDKGLKLVTKIQKNMKNKLLPLKEKLLLKKRGVVESCINLMKFLCDIEHSRHRSPINAIVNILAGIAAYTFLDRKPKINLNYFFINS